MSKTVKQESTKELFTREELLSHKTTSAKCRFLTSLGISRSEISKILNIRYQHVRNIQITPIKSK